MSSINSIMLEGITFSRMLANLILFVYGGVVFLSVGGVIGVGAFLTWGGGWSPLFAVYAVLTMMITLLLLVVDDKDLPFYKGWRADGGRDNSMMMMNRSPEVWEYDYPDHPQKLTLNGLATRLTRVIARIDQNHAQVQNTKLYNLGGGGGGRATLNHNQ